MNAVIPSLLPFEWFSPRLMNAASPSASATRLSSAPATQPTARKREKDLTKPRFVRADHAARLKVGDVRASLALALGKL